MKNFIRNCEGYTLIETLVAMALFLGVLIPLAVSIGNLMIEHSSDPVNRAFHLAVTEMNLVMKESDFSEKDSQQEGYLIQRKVARTGNLVEIEVVVSSLQNPEKKMIHLSKSFLSYQ